MNEAVFDASWNPSALRHTTSELWVMVNLAADRGVDAERCLVGTLLDLQTLCNRRSRVSFTQQVEIQRRIGQLMPDPLWPLRVGKRMQLTSYGMVGYALFSSATLVDALGLARRFAPLLNLKHELKLRSEGGMSALSLHDGYALAPGLREACEVMEVCKLVNLLRALSGDMFRLEEVRVAIQPCADLQEALRAHAGCQVTFGARNTELRFESQLLTKQLPQTDPLTCEHCVHLCEQQLEESMRFDKTTGRVRSLLERCLDALPGMAEVASDLCMSPRSLRRRLEAEGTSFQEIVESIRKDFAGQLLATTRMSTESVADLLGYGDAANFRHAFKRWTGMSPREFRQMHQLPAGTEVLPHALLIRRPGASATPNWGAARH